MEIILVILVSVWKIHRVTAWCLKKVNLSLNAIQHISDTALQQQKVISTQENLIAKQNSVIADLKKLKKHPTIRDYHTQIFSTHN